jgi:hypothetical protein
MVKKAVSFRNDLTLPIKHVFLKTGVSLESANTSINWAGKKLISRCDRLVFLYFFWLFFSLGRSGQSMYIHKIASSQLSIFQEVIVR